jgi:hypothetical protein
VQTPLHGLQEGLHRNIYKVQACFWGCIGAFTKYMAAIEQTWKQLQSTVAHLRNTLVFFGSTGVQLAKME